MRFQYVTSGNGGVGGRLSTEGTSTVRRMSQEVHVPYVLEQDEDGVWCTLAQLRVGDGDTAEAAITDLREALTVLLTEVGPSPELTLTLDVA